MIHGQTKTQHFLEVPDSKTRHGEETFYGCSYLQDKVSMLLKGSETHVENKIINHLKGALLACLVSDNLA